jgi:hypothetical protein
MTNHQPWVNRQGRAERGAKWLRLVVAFGREEPCAQAREDHENEADEYTPPVWYWRFCQFCYPRELSPVKDFSMVVHTRLPL